METSPSVPFSTTHTETKPQPKKPESSFSSRIKAEIEKEHIHEQRMEEENKQIAQAAHNVQTELITTQTVQPVEQLLPPPLLSVYEQNKDFFGEKSIPFYDDRGKGEYKLKAIQNNIVIIQERRRMSNLFLILPRYSIEDIYYVDREKGTSWNVSQLLQNDKGRSAYQLISFSSFNNAGVVETKDGNIIIANQLSDLRDRNKIRKKLKLSSRQEELLDLVIPLHELGHHFQQPPSTSSDSLEKSLLKNLFAEKFLLPFLGILSHISLRLGMYRTLVLTKVRGTWQERNAHAFALSMARKLKSQSVDLFRGYSSSEIADTIDKALFSYDKGLGKYLPGLPYAQRLRKEFRKAGLA